MNTKKPKRHKKRAFDFLAEIKKAHKHNIFFRFEYITAETNIIENQRKNAKKLVKTTRKVAKNSNKVALNGVFHKSTQRPLKGWEAL